MIIVAPRKVLKGTVGALPGNTLLIELKNGEAKVTELIPEAERNKYLGTYLNVTGIEIDTRLGSFIASVREGKVGKVKKIERLGRTLYLELDESV